MRAFIWLGLVLFGLINTAHGLPPAPEPSGAKRFLSGKLKAHEPRDRGVDVQHMALNVRLLPKQREVQGTVVYTGQLRRGVQQLALDGVDLELKKVECGASCTWHYAQSRLTITPKLDAKRRFRVEVTWRASRPAMGMYFIGPSIDEPKRALQVWTQGETHGARHWLPSPDDPDERLTWEVTVRAPAKMTALSNGKRLGVQRVGKETETRYRISKPYPIYLLNVVASELVSAEHRHDRVKLTSWAHRPHLKRARRNGRLLGKMMTFFERTTGVRYPHDRYGQVYVDQFVVGGMENITLTTLTSRSIGDKGLDPDWDNTGLLAHELAHQWFGDLVTCRTWADLWLNEGFATYYQKLFTQHHFGDDRFAEEMASARRTAYGADKYTPRAIISDRYRHPSELFDRHTYIKGAWVLHMLRHKLSPGVFDRGVRAYLEKHSFQSVELDDFRRALEEVSGKSLRGFFRRWLREAGMPKLRVKLKWGDKRLQVSVEQTQKVTGLRPGFALELPIRWDSGDGEKGQMLRLTGRSEQLTIPMKTPPKWVMVDPNMTTLAWWKDVGDADLFVSTLRHSPYPDARLRAVSVVKGQLHRAKVVDVLIDRLRRDPARHVRAAIAKLLGAATHGAVRGALERSALTDKESKVRRAAVAALGQLGQHKAWKTLVRVARGDASNLARRDALTAMSRLDRDKARPWLLKALKWRSWRHVIAGEALMLLAKAADVRDVKHIWKAAKPGNPPGLRQWALTALAAYAIRTPAAREVVREEIERALREPHPSVRRRVAAALESLSDPRSRPALMAAADREPQFRFAERLRNVARGLGKKLPAEKRIKRLEEGLRKLQEREKSSHSHAHRGAGAKDKGESPAAKRGPSTSSSKHSSKAAR